MSKLSAAFGKDWANKYDAGKAKRKANRLIVEGAVKKNIIKTIKAKLDPERPQLMYPTENDYFQILLVESYPDFEPKPLKYGVGIGFKWGRKWVSAAMPVELSTVIEPSTPYILVGKLKVVPGNKPGVEFNNFRVDGIVTMEEIENFKDEGEVEVEVDSAEVAPETVEDVTPTPTE